jgi:NAD(P)-dependent dehydrogenase (short-subunit alcohol dehydrogenase family)
MFDAATDVRVSMPSCGSAAVALLSVLSVSLSLALTLRAADSSRALGSAESWQPPEPPFAGAAVLVTGAGTGLARAACIKLASRGWTVLAGCIRQAEIDGFAGEPNVVALYLDVTSQESVDAAARTAAQYSVVALVNSANVTGAAGPLEHCALEGLDQTLSVCVVGAVRVTQAMMPLLRASGAAGAGRGGFQPRVVMVSSGAGAFAPPMHGPYAAAKFALEALSDVLRREQGEVAVAVVQFSMVATEAAEAWPALVARTWVPDERYRTLRAAAEQQHRELLLPSRALSLSHAARALCHAAGAARPSPRYQVGLGAALTGVLALLPSGLADWLFRKSQGR